MVEGTAADAGSGRVASNTRALREMVLTGSMLRNCRLYLSDSDKPFFPSDAFGERSGGGKVGKTVSIKAGGIEYEPDIRLSSGKKISPRSSFDAFLKGARAVEGGRARISRISDRAYLLDYLGVPPT
jgi:hypothetical protein